MLKDDKKNGDIKSGLEKVLGNVFETAEKIHGAVSAIDFSVPLSENELANLKLHLGFAKNYSDLAKVRLNYAKASEGYYDFEDEEDEDE